MNTDTLFDTENVNGCVRFRYNNLPVRVRVEPPINKESAKSPISCRDGEARESTNVSVVIPEEGGSATNRSSHSRGGQFISDFDGATFNAGYDQKRLGAQLARVKELMKDGTWRTLSEINEVTGDPLQAVSARLRDFRKTKFGGYTVNRRRRGEPKAGLFEYQLIV